MQHMESTEKVQITTNNQQPVDKLMEDALVGRQKTFYVTWILLILVIAFTIFYGYLLYPFAQKISGVWQSNNQNFLLSSQQNKWALKISNYQGIDGFTLSYEGEWKGTGVNKYDGHNVKIKVSINKKLFPENELKELEKKSDFYELTKNTTNHLELEYTKQGIKKMYATNKLDNYFHFSLEPQLFNFKESTLYLNSKFFSENRIPFKLSEN